MTESIRQAYPNVLARLLARWHDLELAEDCLQEACMKGLTEWDNEATPENIQAWLFKVANNIAIDTYRRGQRWKNIASTLNTPPYSTLLQPEAPEHVADANDDLINLIALCAHPSITTETQVMLALKYLLGLDNHEIGAALLKNEKAVEQRITRSKRKISEEKLFNHVVYHSFNETELNMVLNTLYLVFSEGYFSHSFDLEMKSELCSQAVMLCKTVLNKYPNDAETLGLLALMIGHKVREQTRLSDSGEWVTLEDQDRSQWNQELIQLADHYLTRALKYGRTGRYQLQAAVVAIHNEAPHYDNTDWKQILLLYNLLLEQQSSPVIELNRIIALWKSSGSAQLALSKLDQLIIRHKTMATYSHYHSARANLLLAQGHEADAKQSFEQALSLAKNSAERKSLIRKINTL